MKVSIDSAYSLHVLMYMVRHSTQQPATIDTVAKAEGIPPKSLHKIFKQLTEGGLIKVAKINGYVFAKSPEDISLLELFELIEGHSLFSDCLLRHCECGGTPENCCIFAKWLSATKKIEQLLLETSLVAAAWNHPEHRFYSLPESLEAENNKSKNKSKRSKTKVS